MNDAESKRVPLHNGLNFYEDKQGEWRWTAVRGGNIVADSSEGYVDVRDAYHGALAAMAVIATYSLQSLDAHRQHPATPEVYPTQVGEDVPEEVQTSGLPEDVTEIPIDRNDRPTGDAA